MIHNLDPKRKPVELRSTLLVDRSKVLSLPTECISKLRKHFDRREGDTLFFNDNSEVRRLFGMEK